MNHTSLLLSLSLIAVCAMRPAHCMVLRVGDACPYARIQDAVDAIPAGNAEEAVIEILPGDYEENVFIDKNRPFVTLRPAQSGVVRILSAESVYTARDKQLPRCAALTVEADDFTAEDITFENYASRASVLAGGRGVGQAQSVVARGDRAVFRRCRILGHQDTLFADSQHHGDDFSRQYYENCYIEGTVDFIYGCATAVFNACTLNFASRGYLTAASTKERQPFGYIFVGCRVTAAPGVRKSDLGRPWRPYAKVAFIGCDFADVITPTGWSNWRKPENEKTAYFAEFGCTGPGAAAASRFPWVHIGSLADADAYFASRGFANWRAVLAGDDGWNP